jgi:hypothetical protein
MLSNHILFPIFGALDGTFWASQSLEDLASIFKPLNIFESV